MHGTEEPLYEKDCGIRNDAPPLEDKKYTIISSDWRIKIISADEQSHDYLIPAHFLSRSIHHILLLQFMQLSRRAGAFFFAKFITQLIRSPPRIQHLHGRAKHIISSTALSASHIHRHSSSSSVHNCSRYISCSFLFIYLGTTNPSFCIVIHFIMYCDTSEHPPYHWTDTPHQPPSL